MCVVCVSVCVSPPPPTEVSTVEEGKQISDLTSHTIYLLSYTCKHSAYPPQRKTCWPSMRDAWKQVKLT